MREILFLVLMAAPAAAQAWDLQFTEPFDLGRPVEVLDLDPDNHTAEDLAALRARGIKLLCYVSVGTVEDYRSDKDAFPPEVVGKVYGDWPDERFLDIRRRDILIPIMRARFERCHDMGFDAVDPDNQDVYINESGFDVSAEDTLAYMRALADMAHGMGMQIGQKNIPELTPALVGTLDFVVTEDCFQDGWCADVLPYVADGKPVHAIEYTDTGVDFAAACAWGAEHGAAFILKDRTLDGRVRNCP